MSDEIQADGTIESLKTVVNTIKTYAIPEYPENELGQVPFIRAVLDAVVSQVEASIARQETDRETAAANEKYIFSMQALCRGEEVTCALHVSQPIHDLRQQLATLTQERDALKRIIDDTLREVPVGNVNAHIPENLPRDMEYYVQETVKQDFEIERLEKERDALKSQWAIMARACGNWREWPECTVSESAPDYTHSDWQAAARAILERNALHEVVRALISAGDALYIKGKFADPDYWAPCNWAATVVEESAKLLTPSAEAGKGGGV